VAVRYRIDTALGVVFNTYWGVVTDEDLLNHQRELLADATFRAELNQLSNYLDVTGMEVSSALIRTLAESRAFLPGVRRAIVVDNALGYGLSRMYQALHEEAGEDVQVFRDLEAARRWLGLDPELEGAGDP